MQNLEKLRHKHNKKRNTAFLFEMLVKELTKVTVYGDKEKQKNLSSLIKEHFKKGSILEQELTLYKQIYETKQFPKQHAEKLIREVLEQHEKINEQEVFDEQSKLIAKLNKFFGPVIYNNFVPNYKTLATISQVFNKNLEPRSKVLLEQELLEHITEPEKTKANLEPLDSFTMSRFIHKFNETYGKNLLEEQKKLLSYYINSEDDSIDLKIYLNEELSRLKKELSNILSSQVVKENKELENQVNNLITNLNNIKFNRVDEELIKKTMLIQEFIDEVKK